MMTGSWLILSFIITACGLALIGLGLRGRRVDDHPVCRKCRFDLVGVWPGGERCPECGAGLRHSRAVRIGARRKRKGLMAAGVVLSLLAAGGGGALMWSRAASVNWNPYKPMFMLLDEAGWAQPGPAYGALDEIASRIRAGKLSRTRARKLVARALDVQADRATVWNPGWGNIIEEASRHGFLTPEEEARYERQAADVRVEARIQPRIRSGDTPSWRHGLAYEMIPVSPDGTSNSSRCRVGNPGRVVHVLYALESAMLDGQPLALKELVPDRDPIGRFHEIYSLSSSWQRAGAGNIEKERQLDLPPISAEPGSHEITTVWKVQLRSSEDGGDLKAEWTTQATSAFEIVPPDRPLVRLITDPAIGQKIRETCIGIEAQFIPPRKGLTPAGLQVEIRWKGRPANPALVAECIVRAAGTEVRAREAGVSSSPGRATNRYRVVDVPDSWLSADSIDVVLKPDADRATRRGVAEIWGEEIEFRNVPITGSGR